MCHAHNTCHPFYSVTTVFNAATTGPENTQRVFSHSRSLHIIKASSPEDQPGLPLSADVFLTVSTAAGKQIRQMLWNGVPMSLLWDPTFLMEGF